MAAPESAFASFEHKWLQANPEQSTVAAFLAPSERRRASAFGCLVHELEQAAFGGAEASAAAAKLSWWRQEFADAGAGNARHPVARALFADERAAGIDGRLWEALADGALAQLDCAAPATLDQLRVELGAFCGPAARIESLLAGEDPARTDAGARLWMATLVVRGAAGPQQPRAVPMDLLARHGATRSDLDAPGPRRTALLRDLLGQIRGDIEGGLGAAPLAALGRRVRARLDLDLVRRAERAADPGSVLQMNRGMRPWYTLWVAWGEARRRARRGAPGGRRLGPA